MSLNNFYTIISSEKTEDKIIAELSLNPEHSIYKGHFPNQPVVPGIMQIETIGDILNQQLNLNLNLKATKSAKFLNILTPENSNPESSNTKSSNIIAEISYKFEENTCKAKCNIKDENRIFSKFSLVFEQS